MILGILSDSHGDAAATARAVKLLIERGATKLIHCGDICGEGVLDELAGHDVTFVWGNCDAPTPLLRKYVQSLGLPWPTVPGRLAVADKRIAVLHGHEPEFPAAVESGEYDYIFYGHTHRYADDRVGNCRVINPGALYRAAVKTVAIFDLTTDTLSHLRIDSGRILTEVRTKVRK